MSELLHKKLCDNPEFKAAIQDAKLVYFNYLGIAVNSVNNTEKLSALSEAKGYLTALSTISRIAGSDELSHDEMIAGESERSIREQWLKTAGL